MGGVRVHTHTMEYGSFKRKKEILPFVTPWINLEGIMLNKINKTEIYREYILKTVEIKNRLVVARVGGSKRERRGKVQTSSYKRSKSWRSNLQCSVCR